MTFGPYDVLVVGALVAGFIHGRAKGFAWQVSGIATLGLGYLGASAGAAFLFPLFPDAWPVDLKKLAAWIGTYIVVTVAVYLATLRLEEKIKEKKLEELDRRFGGALGATKAALILAVISLAAIATSERAREMVKESGSGPLLARVAFAARPLLPERMGRAVGRVASDIEPPEPEPAPPPPPPRPLPVAPPRPVPHPRPLPVESAPPPLPEPKPPEDHEDTMPPADPPEPPEPPDPLAPPPKK
ncbi:MAG TPA: CvpA family protein [Planctomycetota bacterium]|nr:CvpA family protein [Planctomycetota bacterium]